MTLLTAPAWPLADGVVRLRLPSLAAGDIDAVRGYIDQDQLDGGWLPEIPLVSAERAIGDWLDAWTGRASRNGPTFVVTVPEELRFIGIIGLKDRGEGAVEMIYGIAPRWRGRGLASRAALLTARWALSLLSVTAVELRISQDNTASQHVANNAGFAVTGTVTQFVPGTGETYEDLRYVLEQQPAAGIRPALSAVRLRSAARAIFVGAPGQEDGGQFGNTPAPGAGGAAGGPRGMADPAAWCHPPGCQPVVPHRGRALPARRAHRLGRPGPRRLGRAAGAQSRQVAHRSCR